MCQYSYRQFVQLVRAAIPHRFGNQWLNQQQEQAVSAPLTPPTFIVAGPGSGTESGHCSGWFTPSDYPSPRRQTESYK